jgi:phage major head subunit gpT-like protein
MTAIVSRLIRKSGIVFHAAIWYRAPCERVVGPLLSQTERNRTAVWKPEIGTQKLESKNKEKRGKTRVGPDMAYCKKNCLTGKSLPKTSIGMVIWTRLPQARMSGVPYPPVVAFPAYGRSKV